MGYNRFFLFVDPYLLLTCSAAAVFDARYISILSQLIFLLLSYWPPDEVLPYGKRDILFDIFVVGSFEYYDRKNQIKQLLWKPI